MVLPALDSWNQMINAQLFRCSTVATRLRVSEFDFLIIVKRSHLHRAGRQPFEELRTNHMVHSSV